MEEKRAMTVIYFLVSWAVALGSPAVPSAAAYNWTFLVFRPTAKMVRFIKSNCAGASSRRMTCKASAQLANPLKMKLDLIWCSILFYSAHCSKAENLQVQHCRGVAEMVSKRTNCLILSSHLWLQSSRNRFAKSNFFTHWNNFGPHWSFNILIPLYQRFFSTFISESYQNISSSTFAKPALSKTECNYQTTVNVPVKTLAFTQNTSS